MTVYNSQDASGLIVKITYSDPAGAFGGWFLHVVNGDPNQVDHPYNQSGASSAVSALNPWNGFGERFTKAINQKLYEMLGRAAVQWHATVVNTVTPAVIDDDFTF